MGTAFAQSPELPARVWWSPRAERPRLRDGHGSLQGPRSRGSLRIGTWARWASDPVRGKPSGREALPGGGRHPWPRPVPRLPRGPQASVLRVACAPTLSALPPLLQRHRGLKAQPRPDRLPCRLFRRGCQRGTSDANPVRLSLNPNTLQWPAVAPGPKVRSSAAPRDQPVPLCSSALQLSPLST